MGEQSRMLLRVSTAIDSALPEFAKAAREQEYLEVFDLTNDKWANADWEGVCIYAARFTIYAADVAYIDADDNLNRLTVVCRRLWLIAAHSAIEDGKNGQQYDADFLSDLCHIKASHRPYLKNRIRALDVLLPILKALSKSLPQIWENDSKVRYTEMNIRLSFFYAEVFTQLLEAYLLKAEPGTSANRHKTWAVSLVHIAAVMRQIWYFREDIGNKLVEHILGTGCEINIHSNEILFKFRMLLLMCPSSCCYNKLIDGTLFKWWFLVSDYSVNSWNSMMTSFLLRAVKFGWATGKPYMVRDITTRIPYIFQLLYSVLKIPNVVNITRFKESVPGEFTVLLGKPFNIFKNLGQLLSYFIGPIGDDISKEAPYVSEIADYLTALVNAIYPYTHPSNAGKWSSNIAGFVRYFVLGYTRRICRERAPQSRLSDGVGMIIDGKVRRLTRDNDVAVVELFYTLALQGMYSKNMHLAYGYEDVIKRLCHLQPDTVLVGVLDHLVLSSESVTEPHQLLGALRLFAQLTPLILRYTPQLLPSLLDIATKGIDSSDPFKTGQTLTLINVIFSHLPCKDMSDIHIGDQEKLELVRSIYIKNVDRDAMEVESSMKNLLLSVPAFDMKKSLLHIYDEMKMPKENDGLYSREMVVLNTTKNEEEALEALNAILEQRKIISQNFSCWCQDWFGAMLQLAQNSSKPDSGANSLMNAVDVGTYILTRSALITVLSQTDTSTMGIICDNFLSWVTDNVFRVDALKFMVALATSLSFANGKLAMERVFDKLFLRFKREVENANNELGDDQVSWYTACFSGLVRRANVYILPRMDSIRYIIKVGFSHKSKKSFKYAGKVLQRSVESLMGVYFTDARCSSNFTEDLNRGLLLWDLPWFARDAHFNNGKCDISVVSGVQWHTASKEEIDSAMQLCSYAIWTIVELTKDVIELSVPSMADDVVPIDMCIDSSCTSYMRISRAYILAKYMLRALKDFVADERPVRTKGLPTVTPVEVPEVIQVQRFVLDVILSSMSKFGNIESTDDLVVTKIFHKMLKLVDEYLCRTVSYTDDGQSSDGVSLANSMRQASVLGTTITASKSMLQWMSFYHGVHNTGFWQDAPRATWLMMLHDKYYSRLNIRKGTHDCTGARRQLLNFVLECSTCQYKDVSSYAQDMIKSVLHIHRNIKGDVAEYLLGKGIDTYPQSANGCTNALEILASIPESMKLTLIRKIVTTPQLLYKFCLLVCGVVSTAPNKDSLMSMYDKMLLTLFNCMESISLTDETAAIVSYILDSLLSKASSHGTNHWRFQLYTTAILVSFRHVIPAEMLGAYVSWLMEASDYKSKQSSVATVALFGIGQLLRDENLWEHVPPQMAEPDFAKLFLSSIQAVNHDSIKEENSSTVKKNNSIVVSVIKLERTWPRNRCSSNSKAFSMQNFLVVYHYFRYLLRMGRMDTVACAATVLEELASSPQTSLEYHCAFAEISSALMKASILAATEDRAKIWKFLHPIMKRELDSVVPCSINDFMDGLRLAIEDSDYSSDACIPILNIGINFRAPLSLDSLHKLNLNGGESTSLGVVKQLKLYLALLQQVTTKYPVLFEILCDAALNEGTIFNESCQVVEEIGYLCSFLVSLCCTYGASREFTERIQCYIAQLIGRIDASLSSEKQNESAVKGLLLMIGSLFSESQPAVDLGNKYTSQCLDFCLKFSGDLNRIISESSTGAVRKIALSPYYSGGNMATVEAIVGTLERASKLQSSKIKSTAIKVATMMQQNICMYIRKSDVVERLVELYISALQEKHIWDVARDGLTAVIMSANDQMHLELTQRFYDMIKDGKGTFANAGVFGLAAMVSTSPYHVPNWMPHTLTTMASCASSRFPDVVRKTVQAALQDFFKSHMDAWSQVHVHKFTREQLDVLEMYKGSPTYFN